MLQARTVLNKKGQSQEKESIRYFKLLTLSTIWFRFLSFKFIRVVVYLIIFHDFQSKAIDHQDF